MEVCAIDLETFWTDQHSLKKMMSCEYCMDLAKTQLISCAFVWADAGLNESNENHVAVGEGEIRAYIAANAHRWGNALVVGHNLAEFDSLILKWRLGLEPAMWSCTMAAARFFGHAKSTGLSLAALARHYRVGTKNSAALLETKGRRLEEFTPEEVHAMRTYNLEDSRMCLHLLRVFRDGGFSQKELMALDMTIRMQTDCKLELDSHLLESTIESEAVRRRDMVLELARRLRMIPDADDMFAKLRSPAKFKAVLEELGAVVPMKTSDKGNLIPALSKTDDDYENLLNDPDPLVREVCEIRDDAKSTFLETRARKMLKARECHPQGKMPMPLKYRGADTTGRWSGKDYNPQNMPRICGGPTDAIRNAVEAPPGHVIVAVDQTGIELRVNHTLWQMQSSMAAWQADPGGADLYREFAAAHYHVPQEAVTKEQRQLGKVAELGLGFGAGAATFRSVARSMGGLTLDMGTAEGVVKGWREARRPIVNGWYACDRAVRAAAMGAVGALDPWGLTLATPRGIQTPGDFIHYPKLRVDPKTDSILYKGHGNQKVKLYGGKIVENIVQHLARLTIRDAVLEIYAATGLRPSLLVHDEAVYVVLIADADAFLAEALRITRIPPTWWPALTVWSEGSMAERYGEAK